MKKEVCVGDIISRCAEMKKKGFEMPKLNRTRQLTNDCNDME